MPFWKTKAQNITKLLSATLGRAGFINPRAQDFSRPTAEQLAQRYAMWVHRCTTINAQTAASVPFKLVRVTSSAQAARDALNCIGNCRKLDRKAKAYLNGRMNIQPSMSIRKRLHGNLENLVEIERHPILDLLHDTNPWIDGYAFRESLYADMQIFGRAFTHIIEANDGTPIELWRMLPQKMTVVRDRVRFVSHFEMNFGADRERFDVEEVLWFRQFDPDDPWGGVGPLEAWLKTIDASLYIQDFQLELMKRFGAPDYIVISEAPLSDDQKRSFRRDWRRMFGKLFNRRENIGFLSNSTIERLGQTNKELEFQASEESKRDQIGQAFGIPKALLTTDDVNRANARETRTFHIENTIWPFIQRVEDTLNAQLVPRWGEGLFIMHENPIPDDETIRIEERKSKLESGWSVNEIRLEEGLEPLNDPNADEPMVASTITTLEKAVAEDPLLSFGFGGGGDRSESNGQPPEERQIQRVERKEIVEYEPPFMVAQMAAKLLEPAPVLQQQPFVIPIIVHVPHSESAPIHVQPKIYVAQPEPPRIDANFHIEPPNVSVLPPTVKVDPSFTVESPIVNVNAPDVTVEPPDVIVEQPKVDVAAPNVTILPAEVKVESRPNVNVLPDIRVNIETDENADG